MSSKVKGRVIVALCFIFVLIGPSHAKSPGDSSENRAGEVLLRELIHAPDTLLPAEQSCLGNASITVGDFLSDTLMLLTKSGSGEIGFMMSCDSVKNSPELMHYYSAGTYSPQARDSLKTLDAGVELFQCIFEFQYRQGELAWSRSLQALVDPISERVVEGTQRCLTVP